MGGADRRPGDQADVIWGAVGWVGTKKIPAMTYFLGPQADIIGARGLTDVFGMGTGVSLSLWSPGSLLFGAMVI